MKLIVAGSRFHISEWDERIAEARPWFHSLIRAHSVIEIVSGTSRGYDRVGEALAREFSIEIKRMPADWDNLGKAAGHIRNSQMAEYADALLAYWDGSSRGTENMIKTMQRLGKPNFVVNVK